MIYIIPTGCGCIATMKLVLWRVKKTNHMSLRLMECFIRKHWPGLRGRKNYFSQWGELLKI